MPILGMTDRGASFPRIGELRKGDVKPAQGNRPGRDLEYFRFTSLNNNVLEQFRNVYGNEPNEVHCFLPYATTDENFEAWIEEWGAGSLKWRSNGQTLVMWQKSDGTYSQEPKPQPVNGGKQVGRLKVILPALGRLAYVVALTTSINDIVELHSNLTAYQALRGDLRGIPFILSRVPRMISTPTKEGRVRREKWLLHIEAAPEWVQAQLSVMERQALPGGDSVMMLPPGDVAPDDDDVIEGEMGQVEPPQPETGKPAPANGNGRTPPEQAGQLKPTPPRTIAIQDGKQFIPQLCKQTGWTEDKVREVAKGLGMNGIGKTPAERETRWDTIVTYHALTTDEALSHDLALAVINDVVTLEEARATHQETVSVPQDDAPLFD